MLWHSIEMKKIFATIIVSLLFALNSFANGPVEQIAHAFGSSNAAMVASYFDSSIDLKILDNENIYSRQQARVLLFNFMNDKKPTGFVLKHQGGPNNARFAIGELSARDGVYRIYFLLKEKNSTNYIYKLRIETNE